MRVYTCTTLAYTRSPSLTLTSHRAQAHRREPKTPPAYTTARTNMHMHMHVHVHVHVHVHGCACMYVHVLEACMCAHSMYVHTHRQERRLH